MLTSKSRLPALISLFVLTFSLSPSVFAGWTLNADASSFYYVTSKAAAISELNSFGELSGVIDDAGRANVDISLGTVDTAIDIRNERMRDIVFQVATYPLASVMLSANASELADMEPGDRVMNTYDATIDLHGNQAEVSMVVVVTGLKGGGLLVSLARPLIINAATFGLAEGVEQLREIAGLPSINNNIVVDFTLQFDAD